MAGQGPLSGAIPAHRFTDALRDHGVRRVTGVPCGHLAGPWELFDRAGELTPAASEGAALALAAGWELAGEPAAVLCQNSGLGNLVNPLTSLLLPYRIPVLVVMSLRGWPDPAEDEPQHAVMGESSIAVLTAFGVPHAVVTADGLDAALEQATLARAKGDPFFLLVPRGAIGKLTTVPPAPPAAALTRERAVAAVMAALADELLVTTTGYLSRQAHHERDRPGTFYMQGSMGHAVSIGLGLATARPDRRVVVLDGDGAFLMHLGAGSAVGHLGPGNLAHVVVDNGSYESTGGQRTTSSDLDWAALGRGLGYREVVVVTEPDSLATGVEAALGRPGPVLCVLRVVPAAGRVHPRASASAGLVEIADRFRGEAAGPRP